MISWHATIVGTGGDEGDEMWLGVGEMAKWRVWLRLRADERYL
jgi:hypothetical protein